MTAIVEAVANGEAERGVVPVENSIEGSVTESLDAFAEYDVAVVEEVITPIRHALLAQDDSFSLVASHAQALAQCRGWLDEHYPGVTVEAVASTARGVERARGDAASPLSATPRTRPTAPNESARRGHSGPVLERHPLRRRRLEDRAQRGRRQDHCRVYPNANYPGLLLELLEAFAERDINLSRIESRPSGNRLGDYVFHIDISAGLYEQRTQEALADIEDIAEKGWVRRLGSYDSKTVVN